MSFKLAVFTGWPLSHLVLTTLSELRQRLGDIDVLVLANSPPRSAKKLVRSQLRKLRYHGWRWVPFQAGNIGRVVAARVGRAAPVVAADRLPATLSIEAAADHPRVRVERFGGLASAEAIAVLTEFKPDLGLSLGGPILKAETFEIPRLGTINLHQGRLPDYRGMPPAFWEILNGETEAHASVHRVEKGLDTGNVIATVRVAIEKFSTPAAVRVRLDAVSPRLIGDAVAGLIAGKAVETQQTGKGRTNRRPPLAVERQLARKIEGRRGVAARAKSAVLTTYATVSGFSRAKRDSVAVLLYHRVCDTYRDNVTCGVEMFDRHMAYLADHHRVVPMSRLLKGPLPSGEGPVVAITFDDGYLDNYEQATPVLIKHGLPATFFVSTRIVDEGLIFPHDQIALGHIVPTMTWDHMREMQIAGLTIGGHTANHVNMAQVDDATAAAELAVSRDMLREKLGLTEPMFAYPYGKCSDFTPARLAQVKAAGYVANCSAYGGVNGLEVDRWNIQRFGVDYRFDIAALRSRIYGWDA